MSRSWQGLGRVYRTRFWGVLVGLVWGVAGKWLSMLHSKVPKTLCLQSASSDIDYKGRFAYVPKV